MEQERVNPERDHGREAQDLSSLTSSAASKLRDEVLQKHRVAIVGGLRTPFVKAGGSLGQYGQLELGTHAVAKTLEGLDLKSRDIDEIIYGAVVLNPRVPNLARQIAIDTDLPKHEAHFVSNNCITSLVAVHQLANDIATGRIRSGIAGGVESLSNPTLMLTPQAEKFWMKMNAARTVKQRVGLLREFRFGYLIPQGPSPREASTGLTMGQHCELTARELSIPRDAQDELAFRSHQNAARAKEQGYLATEIAPLGDVSEDNIIRASTTLEKLASLSPAFRLPSRLSQQYPGIDFGSEGTLTAGNSSAMTDGASAVCLMSESEARRQGREVLGYVSGIEFAAVDPHDGLLQAPGVALPKLMQRHGLSVDDIDRFEVHEAFAAQVLANQSVWRDGWEKYGVSPIGEIPGDRMNVNGGSLALGHPFAATGSRIVLSLVNELKRSGLSTGVISVCAAGGMACAMLVKAGKE